MDQNQNSPITITDLNEDSLARCAEFLNLQDISNVARTCKSLRQVAYSDSIWQPLFRERWQHLIPPLDSSVASGGARDAYLSRLTALQQFKFEDPLVADMCTQAEPYGLMLLDRDDIFMSRGSSIQMMEIAKSFSRSVSLTTLSDHNARITCMRLFPLYETSLFRSEGQRSENFLVTSSSDHSIRFWWKVGAETIS